MHDKSDSEDGTILAPPSPQSPKPAVYYVQSPSHDGYASKSMSIHTALAFNSPTESSSSRYSRESSSSRFSGTTVKWPPGSRHKRPSNYCGVIDEDARYVDHPFGDRFDYPLRCRILILVFSFSLLFSAACLVVWGAAKPFDPRLTVQSLTVHNFYFGEGSDLTGVPSKFVTTNCSVRFIVHNPATFYGIHVRSMPINLLYSQISVATGETKRYYQPRKSRRTMNVNLRGSRVALYGAGASIPAFYESRKVPMRLEFELLAKGNVVGKLVKSTHRRLVSCSVVISGHSTQFIRLNQRSCTVR